MRSTSLLSVVLLCLSLPALAKDDACKWVFGAKAGTTGKLLGILKSYTQSTTSRDFYIVGVRSDVKAEALNTNKDELGFTPNLMAAFPKFMAQLGFYAVSRKGHGLPATAAKETGIFWDQLLAYPGDLSFFNATLALQSSLGARLGTFANELQAFMVDGEAKPELEAYYLARGRITLSRSGPEYFKSLNRDAFAFLLIPEPIIFQVRQNLGALEYMKLNFKTQKARLWLEDVESKYFALVKQQSHKLVSTLIEMKLKNQKLDHQVLRGIFNSMIFIPEVGSKIIPDATTGLEIYQLVREKAVQGQFALDPKERKLIADEIELLKGPTVRKEIDFDLAIRLLETLE